MVDHIPQKHILHPYNQWELVCLHGRLHILNSCPGSVSHHRGLEVTTAWTKTKLSSTRESNWKIYQPVWAWVYHSFETALIKQLHHLTNDTSLSQRHSMIAFSDLVPWNDTCCKFHEKGVGVVVILVSKIMWLQLIQNLFACNKLNIDSYGPNLLVTCYNQD